jgi:hypothetical protein
MGLKNWLTPVDNLGEVLEFRVFAPDCSMARPTKAAKR